MLSGTVLKKEVNQCNAVAMDLPKDHGLRKSLLEYKQRFEDEMEELLGTYLCM